jgi:hypothetical protein
MRYAYAIVLGIGLVVLTPEAARAQGAGSVEGFGGLAVDQFSSSSLDFGGRVSIDLVPEVQAIGEFGRIGNVLPRAADILFSISPLDVRASAFYGQGGVRFLVAPRSRVNPYAEAAAGFARLNYAIPGVNNVLVNAGLSFLDRTEPIAGVGGGVIFRGGPVILNLGYRYTQIFANDLVGRVLGGCRDLRSNQVRFGVGVRF